MFVRQLMQTELVTLAPGTRCREAYKTFRRERIRRAPVVSDEKLVGLVSERDLLRALPALVADADGAGGEAWHDLSVEQVMTTAVEGIGPEAPVEEAARRMVAGRFGGLPVVSEEGAVVGMVTTTDLLTVLAAGARDDSTRLLLEGSDTTGMEPLLEVVRELGLELMELVRHPRAPGSSSVSLAVRGATQADGETLSDRAWDSGWRVLGVDPGPAGRTPR